MAKSQTVKFNFSGEKFELSRSLLDMYPNTVLSISASERWLEDPEKEVFMDRDPVLFRHVLSYLRDKRVYLPTTVAKKAILLELEYYCVDDVDEDAIDDSLTQGYLAADGFEKMIDSIEKFDKEFQEGVKQANSIFVAKECVERFLALRGDQKELEVAPESLTGLRDPTIFYTGRCNEYLEKVGLQMIKPDNNVSLYIVLRIKGIEDIGSKRKEDIEMNESPAKRRRSM